MTKYYDNDNNINNSNVGDINSNNNNEQIRRNSLTHRVAYIEIWLPSLPLQSLLKEKRCYRQIFLVNTSIHHITFTTDAKCWVNVNEVPPKNGVKISSFGTRIPHSFSISFLKFWDLFQGSGIVSPSCCIELEKWIQCDYKK